MEQGKADLTEVEINMTQESEPRFNEMENVAGNNIILNPRYLDDEQLIRSEQLEVLGVCRKFDTTR